MKIVQVLLDGASLYDRKSQQLDADALREAEHEVSSVSDPREVPGSAAVAHVYGRGLTRAAFQSFGAPYIASEAMPAGSFWSRRTKSPRVIVGPVAAGQVVAVPEAVADAWFAAPAARSRRSEVRTVGSYVADRAGVPDLIDRTLARIHRFRDDIRWKRFATPPSPDDLSALDAWIDPALHAEDYDGCVAEAVVAGMVVVASRTPLNTARLEQGRTGFLTPVNDPNELTHAILAALFKPEVAQQKKDAARQTVSKFRVRQRLRVLTRIYQDLTS